MPSSVLHIFNCMSQVLPTREFIGLRRKLLRLAGVGVGRDARIAHGVCMQGGNIVIGSGVWIGPLCFFSASGAGTITIGNNIDIAPRCAFVTGSHEMGTTLRRAGTGYSADIEVGDGCWLGASVTLLGGAHLGEGCVVAAGAVVKPGTYPPNSLLAGVPARVKKTLPV